MKRSKLGKLGNFDLTQMCTPATIYFVISLISLILIGVNNVENNDKICIGNYNCYVGNNATIFILNAIYILFWTFVLDLMCKSGYSSLSWFVLLLPFIIIFILFTTLMVREGILDGKGKQKHAAKNAATRARNQGTTNATNVTGNKGATNATGNQGTTNATNATGNQGITNATGVTGTNGGSGNQGATNATGVTGTTGGSDTTTASTNKNSNIPAASTSTTLAPTSTSSATTVTSTTRPQSTLNK